MRKILILVILVLFIAGCAFKGCEKAAKEEIKPAAEEAAPARPAFEMNCQNLEAEAKQSCINFNALSSATQESDCNVITNDAMKQNCVDNVIFRNVLSQDDVSLCDRHSDKTKCVSDYYTRKAIAEDNPAVCDQITDETAKANCKSGFQAKLDFASMGKGECDDIVNEGMKQSCVYSKIVNEVQAKDDVTICNQLTVDKDRCVDSYYFQKARTTGDVSFCEQTKVPEDCKNQVYMAKKECDKITNENLKKFCEGGFP